MVAMSKKDVASQSGEGRTGVKTKPGDLLPKMLPGTVCAQMVKCGKHNCKCARGELHGPYYYHFSRANGVLVKRYVKAKDVARVRAACDFRRTEGRRRRETVRASARQLTTIIERIRRGEELLLKIMESQHGKNR